MPRFTADSVIQQIRLHLERGEPDHARVYAEWLRRMGHVEHVLIAEQMLQDA